DLEDGAARGFRHIVAQHQVDGVRLGDDDAVAGAQAAHGADIEIAFDLLVDTAHRLQRAVLIYRAGDADALRNRHACDGREDGDEFGGARAVAVYRAVIL